MSAASGSVFCGSCVSVVVCAHIGAGVVGVEIFVGGPESSSHMVTVFIILGVRLRDDNGSRLSYLLSVGGVFSSLTCPFPSPGRGGRR